MKDKIYFFYKNNCIEELNKVLDKLSNSYFDNDHCRIVDLCNDFGITCGMQDLKINISSYAMFNGSYNNRFNNNKVIVVNSKFGVKYKRMQYAYNFFKYIYNDNNEIYDVVYEDIYDIEYYDSALKLLLPEKRILKDYKKYRSKNSEMATIMMLSDKYLVSYNGVESRIKTLNKNKKDNLLFKKIKRI